MTKQEQIDYWFKLYGRQITEEKYREICDNLSGFLKILQEWKLWQQMTNQERLRLTI
jgi:hypothetical protein